MAKKYSSKIAENITIESLNENATRAILKWKNGENYEWLAIDLSDPERSINLTDNFSTSFSKIAPKNRNHSKLYALTAYFHLRRNRSLAHKRSRVICLAMLLILTFIMMKFQLSCRKIRTVNSRLEFFESTNKLLF